MWNSHSRVRAFLLAFAAGGSCFACRQTTVLATDSEVPTATVKEVDLQLKVITTGVLRTSQSRTIIAPLIAGGTLQIVTLARSGAQVHAGDVSLKFGSSQQEYYRATTCSEMQQGEQEIVKANDEAAGERAED